MALLGGSAPTLADACPGRDNNLNLVRVLAATAVLVSHAFPVTRGPGAIEPLQTLTGHSLGWLAVAVFFVISGFLIARSYDRRISAWHWLTARVLRLYPGLLVVLLVTVLVLGPVFTILPAHDYWSAAETWTYVPRNLALGVLQYALPGVFLDVPMTGILNGSLWTLLYEVTCYAGVFVAGIFGALRLPRRFAVGLVAVAVLSYLVIERGLHFGLAGRAEPLVLLAYPFVLGMSAYVWRDRLRLDWRLGVLAWAATVAACFTPAFTIVYMAAIAYTTLLLGYRLKGPVLGYNRLGDYSYGIYIYAFPLQQLAEHVWPGQSWLTNVALAFPATLLCAVLSWHLVEQRALAWAKPAAERWSTFWRREGRGAGAP